MIPNVGVAEIVLDMADLISDFSASSASSDPAATDTTMTDIIATGSVTDIVATNATLSWQAAIDSGTANSQSVFTVGTITTNAVLFTKDLHPEFEKTSSDEVRYFFKITAKRGS